MLCCPSLSDARLCDSKSLQVLGAASLVLAAACSAWLPVASAGRTFSLGWGKGAGGWARASAIDTLRGTGRCLPCTVPIVQRAGMPIAVWCHTLPGMKDRALADIATSMAGFALGGCQAGCEGQLAEMDATMAEAVAATAEAANRGAPELGVSSGVFCQAVEAPLRQCGAMVLLGAVGRPLGSSESS